MSEKEIIFIGEHKEPVSEETIQKVQEGMDLFVEYFRDLWN